MDKRPSGPVALIPDQLAGAPLVQQTLTRQSHDFGSETIAFAAWSGSLKAPVNIFVVIGHFPATRSMRCGTQDCYIVVTRTMVRIQATLTLGLQLILVVHSASGHLYSFEAAFHPVSITIRYMRSNFVTITVFRFTTFILSFLGLSPSCPPSDASVSFSEVCSPELQWPIGGDTPSAAVAIAGKGYVWFLREDLFPGHSESEGPP